MLTVNEVLNSSLSVGGRIHHC